jgi:hypothetical protein
MNIEIINVSNGTLDYPGNFTPEEIKIIEKNCKGSVLHLFSGKSKIGDIRIDFKFGNTFKKDVFEFLPSVYEKMFDTIIIDAPYNEIFADKYQKIGDTPEQFIIFADTEKTTKLFEFIDKIDPEVIILKSWNYYCLKRYRVDQCYICYPGGYRKSTFLIIMKRKQVQLSNYITKDRKTGVSRSE